MSEREDGSEAQPAPSERGGALWADPQRPGDDEADTAAEVAAEPADVVTTKVCPKCSVQETTAGEFCPHCGARYAKKRRSKRTKVTALAALGALVLAGGATAAVLKVSSDDAAQQKRDERHQAEVAAEAAQAAQAKREAQAKEVADHEAAAQRKLDRQLSSIIVHEMEKRITKDAKKDVDLGVLEGPILGTDCSPAAGGGTKSATPYDCMAITTRNDDGTIQGYNFSATANMKNGSFTWKLGD
jgi:hypothetical protein